MRPSRSWACLTSTGRSRCSCCSHWQPSRCWRSVPEDRTPLLHFATSSGDQGLEWDPAPAPAGALPGAIMLNTNAGLWPQMAANSTEAETVDPWGLGTVMETQARLWNHLLDANRSFWEFYAPWFTSGPSLWNVALAPLQQDEAGDEPE